LTLLLAVAAGSAASAHRRDEYLQAARLALEPDRVRVDLDLTPGIAVADRVLADVDGDRDGAISPAEAQSYAGRVLGTLSLDVDGVALTPRVTGTTFPEIAAMRNGEGAMSLQIVAALPPLSSGIHRLRYRNAHRPDIGVYLANALVPASDRVRVVAQDRDVDQRTLSVDYTLAAAQPSRLRGSARLAAPAALAALGLMWIAARRRATR
jgi:hypothetical protein